MQVKHICQIPTTIYIINDVLRLGGWNVSPRFEPYICMGACACARARARARLCVRACRWECQCIPLACLHWTDIGIFVTYHI